MRLQGGRENRQSLPSVPTHTKSQM